MAWVESRCVSCGEPLAEKGGVLFRCPACGKGVVGRCGRCRDQSVAYRCDQCGFEGP